MTELEPATPAESIGTPMVAAAPRRLSTLSQVLFASGTIGNGLLPQFLASWQMYYFAPPADSGRPILVAAVTVGWVNLIGQIAHSLADGFIGHASDRTRTRWGRRIPWIAVSAPITSLAFMALWWPPSGHVGWINIAWLAGVRAVMWIAYTGAVGPYCSLLPEVTEGEERTRVAVFMALFEVIGTILGVKVTSMIIDAFPDGASLGPFHLTDGYKYAAAIMGLISLASMWISILVVREKPHDATKEVPYGMLRSLAETLRNPAFRPYVLAFVAFRIALLAIILLLPYQADVVLHLEHAEEVAGNLQIVIVIGSVLLFWPVDLLARRFGKRQVMLWGFLGFGVVMCLGGLVGKLPLGSPLMQAYVVYGLSAFPVATLFVLPRPILADVIDRDAELTGFRREGIYNGAEGMLTKFAEGVGPMVAGVLFAWFGNTREHPLGVVLVAPVAGVFCLWGWWLFRKYPIEG